MSDIPSVGRIVHYRSSTSSECMAALVTRIHPDVVHGPGVLNLNVYYFDGGQAPRFGVREGTSSGQWHWPERTGGPVAPGQIYLMGEQ